MKVPKNRTWELTHRAQVLAGKKADYEKHKSQRLAQQKAKREADKEGFYAHRRQLYAANRARMNEVQRKRYAVAPERRLENNRKYRAARLDEFRERDKKYSKAWQAKHYERFRAIANRGWQKRRALKAGAFVEDVERLTVFRRDKGVCGICHRKVDPKSKWHIDHVIPLSKSGLHSYANVQLTHARCNLSKQSTLPTGQLGLLQKAAT